MRLPQVRVAVNSRCERSCYCCRPSGEAVATESGTDLDPDHRLIAVATAARAQGVDGIKPTGGDPALYGPLVEVVRRTWARAAKPPGAGARVPGDRTVPGRTGILGAWPSSSS
ncbi:hypothetical protein ABZ532_06895 [Streptomyces sp. NPDC019396]|uniref:hypothetical protein n=1 Tax=Streptomyces sp. NPDC019396 TaxID=3154687 RepID=UPI0033DBDE6D